VARRCRHASATGACLISSIELREQYPEFVSPGEDVISVTKGDIAEMIHLFSFIQKGEPTGIRKASRRSPRCMTRMISSSSARLLARS